MRRVDRPDLDSSAGALPWKGLPPDLWQRGRSARIGERFVGDVARVMADILATDARRAADAAVAAVNGDRFVAAWDALRYLSARVEALEARVDPVGLEPAEWPGSPPDPRAWVGSAGAWFGGADRDLPVIVGESGDGTLVEALLADGYTVRGVDPRGASVWESFPSASGSTAVGAGPRVGLALDHVDHHLRSLPDDSAAGVVLVGCVDRADLADKMALLRAALRVTTPGGSVVVLAEDQEAWEASLSHPARDLAPGRPLHPETWSLLLRRLGAAEPVWHRPESGSLHAVVARVEP
jgi:hypothetical protein